MCFSVSFFSFESLSGPIVGGETAKKSAGVNIRRAGTKSMNESLNFYWLSNEHGDIIQLYLVFK